MSGNSHNLSVVYLIAIVNLMPCSLFLFWSHFIKTESYLVFLPKHCKLYTKDISYYFSVYKDYYFITLVNHL